MSAREYEPGTVAVATVRGVEGVRVMRVDSNLSSVVWASAQGPGPRLHEERSVADVRPLVVLDLDGFDTEQAARSLDDAANGQIPTPGNYDERRSVVFHVAQAIREQTRPAKPAEPTGLGAVVVDAGFGVYVRTTRSPAGSPAWRLSHWCDDAPLLRWEDVAVVAVESEGKPE